LGEPSLKVSKAVVGHRAHYLSLVKAVPRYPYRLRAVQQKKRNRSLSLPNRCRLGRAAVFRFLLAAATIHPISNEAPAIPLERLQMCSRFELAGENSNNEKHTGRRGISAPCCSPLGFLSQVARYVEDADFARARQGARSGELPSCPV
jgi:hypothetical protein